VSLESVVRPPGGSAFLGVSPFWIRHGSKFLFAEPSGQPLNIDQELSAVSFQLEPQVQIPSSESNLVKTWSVIDAASRAESWRL